MTAGTGHNQPPNLARWLNRHGRRPAGQARVWRCAATSDDRNDRVAQDLLHNWANHLFGAASDEASGSEERDAQH